MTKIPLSPFRLHGFVQQYDWGGYSFIPSFLGIENAEKKPYAELWLGVHPKGSARIDMTEQRAEEKEQGSKFSGQMTEDRDQRAEGSQQQASAAKITIGLNELIAGKPLRILGKGTLEKFGPTLPFLFKILDARDMLSIQVHPSKKQAEVGFAAENSAGIALESPRRNYKDENHKPEVHVALTDFYMLHGFRPLDEIADILTAIPSFNEFAPDFVLHLSDLGRDQDRQQELLKGFYRKLLELPQDDVDRAINDLLPRIERLYDSNQLKKISPHYWAVKAARSFPLPGGHRDRGLFSIYLLNLLHLKPGQGTFQPAGLLHAYLEGTTIELMANSDNVLRGGLTAKYVDVQELLKIVDFRPGPGKILNGEPIGDNETIYRIPADDFQLIKIHLEAGQKYQSQKSHGPEIWIVLQGTFNINENLAQRGDCYLIPADFYYSLSSLRETTIYKATMPLG